MNIIETLSQILTMKQERLNNYLSTCPYRYKVYEIQKRNGRGSRTIAHPAKELKFIQSTVMELFFNELPVHTSCTAYVKGKNIKENALKHANNQYLLKIDFKDFFPSIRSDDFIEHLKKYYSPEFTTENEKIIRSIFFYKKTRSGPLTLSIGAPSSPFISNTILFDLDSKLYDLCKQSNICYTRYADDLAFSTNKKGLLFKFFKYIKEVIQEVEYPSLTLNPNKTVFLSKKDNRHITGLVLTNEGTISIGRKKKRIIKSLIHRFNKGELREEDRLYLSGYLSFIWSVEPSFLDQMKRKYGDQTIQSIFNIK